MTIRSKRKHRVRRVVAAVCENGWAIDPAKMALIVEFLEMRAGGFELTPEEIAARIGAGARASLFEDDDDDSELELIKGVAVLPLYGVLAPRLDGMMAISGGTSTQQFASVFNDAVGSPEVKAIVIDVDSPGGTVAGGQELADLIYNARGSKPIHSVSNSQMASAALWIGTGADKVHVSHSSSTGSVGVIAVQRENSKALEKAGTKFNVISAGEHKADGNPYEPLSDSARAAMQSRIDDMYDLFVGALARNRGITAEAVEERFGQGQSFVAAKAVAAGMADDVATLDQVVRSLASTAVSVAMPKFPTFILDQQPPVTMQEAPAVWEQLRAALVAQGCCAATASETEVKAVAAVFLAGRGHKFTSPEAALAIVNSPPPAAESAWSPLRTALVAQRFCAPHASDEQVKSAASVFLNVRGQQFTTPEAALAIVNASQATPPIVGAFVQPDATAAAQAALAGERERVRSLRARGQALGISAEIVDAAIDGGQPVEAALLKWTDKLADGSPPVTRGPSVIGSNVENVFVGASEALFARSCAMGSSRPLPTAPKPQPLSAAAKPFERMHLSNICSAVLEMRGIRCSSLSNEQVAQLYLKTTANDFVPLAGQFGEPSYNTPGLYPNLLSALANKIMDAAAPFAPATYRQWTYELEPVNDFLPRTMIAMGASGELPLVKDGEDFTQSSVAEEASFIGVDKYGDEFLMTPVMIANNNLQAFSDIAQDKSIAGELTLNRLCVNLLTGNPALVDNIAFFNASHGNLIAGGSGGVVTVAQLGPMRQLMRNQTSPGAKRKLSFPPVIALVPTSLETGAEQVLLPSNMIPQTDANVNVFRSRIQPVVDPMLDDASTLIWYLFADPRMVRTIVIAFMQGYQGGARQSYYNPKNQCQVFQIDCRFAAAVRNWRGAVMNTGN
jgi:signal peptide peptidase SppA